MALSAVGQWQPEDDGDPRRESLRQENLREAYSRERDGYLDKVAAAGDDDVAAAKWQRRVDAVTAAAAGDGVPLPPARRRETSRR
jgi:hypothetical protein